MVASGETGTGPKVGGTAADATTFADHTVTALRDAIRAGWREREERKEPEFDALRAREDFMKPLVELDHKSARRRRNRRTKVVAAAIAGACAYSSYCLGEVENRQSTNRPAREKHTFGERQFARDVSMSGQIRLKVRRSWLPTPGKGRVWMRLLVFFLVVTLIGLFLQFGPYSAYGYCRRGRAWTDQKDYAKAIAEYSEAIRINPKLAEAYDGRGFAWSVKKDYAKAIADFDEAIRLDPQSDHAYYERANAWLEKKDYDKAILDYTEAIRLNAESPYAYYARAGTWIQKKEFDKAIADDNAFLKRIAPMLENLDEGPGTKDGEMNAFYAMAASAFTERGSAWQLKNDNDKALADFNDAIRLDPKNAGARVCRGNVWQSKSEYAKALADYDEAIRLDSSDFAAYAHRAGILAASPDPKYRHGPKAFAAAKKACELTAGKDATSLEALAMSYAEAGDFALAVKWQLQAMAAPNQIREMRIEQETRLALYQEKIPYRYPTTNKP